MIREAQLVFKNYIVDTIEPGMLYLAYVHPIGWQVYKIEKAPQDSGLYILDNGYPVQPYIVDIGNPNVPYETIIAVPSQIGWMDEGDDVDELCDIEIKHINTILDKYDGWLFIETDEDGEPILFMDKVTISYADDIDDEWDDDDDDENIQDWDDDDYKAIF
jgi:hypothetical protein